MTNEDLIAKQVAIIQMQEIELQKLRSIKEEFIQYKINKIKEDVNRANNELISHHHGMEMSFHYSKMVDRKQEEIEFLKQKLKKRPKFIMIINRRKK